MGGRERDRGREREGVREKERKRERERERARESGREGGGERTITFANSSSCHISHPSSHHFPNHLHFLLLVHIFIHPPSPLTSGRDVESHRQVVLSTSPRLISKGGKISVYC